MMDNEGTWEQKYQGQWVEPDQMEEAYERRVMKDYQKSLQEATKQKMIESMEAEVARQFGLMSNKTYRERRDLGGGVYEEFLITTDEHGDIAKEEHILMGGKPLKKEMQPGISGKLEDILPNVDIHDIMSVQPMGPNPCAEVLLPGTGSCATPSLLDSSELEIANRIEDCLEKYLTDHYTKDTLEYDIDLPDAPSPRVFEFIRERMYNWTIYTINDKKWRLTWG